MNLKEAKNVVFVFSDDPVPSLQEVHKMATDYRREVLIHKVNSHSEMKAILNSTPIAFEHFVTKSAPRETLRFLEPVVLGVTNPFYLYGYRIVMGICGRIIDLDLDIVEGMI